MTDTASHYVFVPAPLTGIVTSQPTREDAQIYAIVIGLLTAIAAVTETAAEGEDQ
jgi:hypothetical protein